jgi:hypothetical protein
MSTNNLTSCQEQAVSGMPMPANVEEETVARVPTYVVELSKSGRAMCKKCDEKILNKELRVGVIVGLSLYCLLLFSVTHFKCRIAVESYTHNSYIRM